MTTAMISAVSSSMVRSYRALVEVRSLHIVSDTFPAT